MPHSSLIEAWFTKPNPDRSPLFRFGFLGFLLLLVTSNVALAVMDSPIPAIQWARRLVIPTGLLLNHLAFFFPLRHPWLAVTRSLAYTFLIIALILLFAAR